MTHGVPQRSRLSGLFRVTSRRVGFGGFGGRAVPAIPAGTWRSGVRPGPVMVLPHSPPIEAYTQKARRQIFADGIAQGVMGGWAAAQHSVTSPGTFSNIAFTVVSAGGYYTISWTVQLGGTVGAGDANNFRLTLSSGPVLATSVNAGAAGTYPQAPVTVFIPAGATINIQSAGSAPTAGSVYTGIIPGNGVSTVSVGPSGIGTRWYPQQITLATQSGPNDASTALGYLGAVAPQNLQFSSLSGGGDVVGLAVPEMQPGDLFIVAWSGGHAGDWTQLTVVGDMEVLVL
jgi:hypothetical protein